jgi:hypothetical protein
MRSFLMASLLISAMGGPCTGSTPAPGSSGAQAGFSLRGSVLEEPHLSPLSGVLIELESDPRMRAVTDSLGTYHMDSIPSGTHWITARVQGYLPERRRVQLLCQPAVVRGAREVVPGRCTATEQSLSFLMRAAFVH